MNGIPVLSFFPGLNLYFFKVVLVSGFHSGIKLWGRNHKLVLILLPNPVDSWWLKEHCVEREQAALLVVSFLDMRRMQEQ